MLKTYFYGKIISIPPLHCTYELHLTRIPKEDSIEFTHPLQLYLYQLGP